MRKFNIAILVTTRGRPERFLRLVDSFHRNALFTDRIKVWCYVDDDDEASLATLPAASREGGSVKFDIVVGPRPLTLGIAVNQLYEKAKEDSDLFFFIGDEYVMETKAWDLEFDRVFSAYPDGIVLGYVPDTTIIDNGGNEDQQVTLPIMTRAWGERVGYFWPDDFPFWWSDTWLDEIALMVGRKAPVRVRVRSAGKGKTYRFWNAPFWARVFERGFPDRLAAASKLWQAIPGHEGDEEGFFRAVSVQPLADRFAAYRLSEGIEGILGELTHSGESGPPSAIYLEAERRAYERYFADRSDERQPAMPIRAWPWQFLERLAGSSRAMIGDQLRGEPLFLLAERYGCTPGDLLAARNAFILGVVNNSGWRLTP
ncbi:hypothetical protein [Azospirillum sp.]|uniref:hypothetical protein n=1 Tax=Azospirillum sp. TaxID=34012 RepID=UPI002D4746D7|nr:hypothetical protein [Azospirillum sp.]HYD63869.1 hypothetical protein [Azospirillum sp.]